MCLNSDGRFYKTDSEFILRPTAVPLCHWDFKLFISPDPRSHASEGALLCHICADLDVRTRKQCGTSETPDPGSRDPRPSFSVSLAVASWGKQLNSSGQLRFTSTNMWGNHVPQIMCVSAMESAVRVSTTHHTTNVYWDRYWLFFHCTLTHLLFSTA